MACGRVVKALDYGQEISSSCPTCKVFLHYRRQAPLLFHFSTYSKLQFCVNYLLLCITFSPVFPVFGCNMYPGIQHTAKTKGTKGLRVLCIVLSCRTELYCELHIAHSYNLHAVYKLYVHMYALAWDLWSIDPFS